MCIHARDAECAYDPELPGPLYTADQVRVPPTLEEVRCSRRRTRRRKHAVNAQGEVKGKHDLHATFLICQHKGSSMHSIALRPNSPVAHFFRLPLPLRLIYSAFLASSERLQSKEIPLLSHLIAHSTCTSQMCSTSLQPMTNLLISFFSPPLSSLRATTPAPLSAPPPTALRPPSLTLASLSSPFAATTGG